MIIIYVSKLSKNIQKKGSKIIKRDIVNDIKQTRQIVTTADIFIKIALVFGIAKCNIQFK